MIRVNGKELTVNHFPDGTLLLKPGINIGNHAIINWNFENNEEMAVLLFIANHLKANGIKNIELVMPYIPNARQDRVKNKDEDVFTLKYFAEFINAIGFSKVYVLDPHSSVSEALFDNLVIDSPKNFIQRAISRVYEITNNEELIAFFPDEGAMKRYSSNTPMPYAFGVKLRDWQTGNILGLDVIGDAESIKGKNILIIDDICSRGGTFYHSAKKLKELGANKIFLYVTHCEKTIMDGEIFSSGLIEKVFTTDSIFNDSVQIKMGMTIYHDKMEVFEYDKQNESYVVD